MDRLRTFRRKLHKTGKFFYQKPKMNKMQGFFKGVCCKGAILDEKQYEGNVENTNHKEKPSQNPQMGSMLGKDEPSMDFLGEMKIIKSAVSGNTFVIISKENWQENENEDKKEKRNNFPSLNLDQEELKEVEMTPKFGKMSSEQSANVPSVKAVYTSERSLMKGIKKEQIKGKKNNQELKPTKRIVKRSLDQLDAGSGQKFVYLKSEKREKILKEEPIKIKEMVLKYDSENKPRDVARNKVLNDIKKDLKRVASQERSLVSEKYKQTWKNKKNDSPKRADKDKERLEELREY